MNETVKAQDVKKGDRVVVVIVSTMDGDLLDRPKTIVAEAASDAYVFGNRLSVDFWRHDIEHVAEWDLEREEWVECAP